MRTALVLVLAMLAGCATVPEDGLTPEQIAQCEAEGGCLTITRRALYHLIQDAIAAGRKGSV